MTISVIVLRQISQQLPVRGSSRLLRRGNAQLQKRDTFKGYRYRYSLADQIMRYELYARQAGVPPYRYLPVSGCTA